MKKSNPLKRPLFLSFFIVVDVLIAIFLCELWARSFVKVVNLVWVHDKRLGIMLAPKQRRVGYVEGKYYNIVQTNNYGFVDDDWSKTKPKGVIRIEAFGDSFLAGLQTNLTITHFLEKFLNASGTGQYDIMNFGMVNGGTAKELTCYETLGKKFKHDYVMLFFMGNDIRDNNPSISVAGNTNPYYLPDKNGELLFWAPKFEPESFILSFLRKHVLLTHILANKFLASELLQDIKSLEKHFKKNGESDNTRANGHLEHKYQKAVYITLRLIDEFNRRAKNNGAKLILLDCEKFSNQIRKYFSHKQLEKFCVKRGIPYIPVYPMYARLYEQKDKFVFLDGHLKAKGNKRIAHFIFEKLRKKEILVD